MNRRITATITAVCIGVLFTGCSGNVDTNSEALSSESESETSVSQSDAVETALPEAESASEVNTYYDYIIDLLVEVRSGQADDDTMMTFTETMSPDFMYVSADAPDKCAAVYDCPFAPSSSCSCSSRNWLVYSRQ